MIHMIFTWSIEEPAKQKVNELFNDEFVSTNLEEVSLENI